MSEVDPLDETADDLVARLAEDYAERCRRGDPPTIASYESRYPEHSERLRGLLPAVALMEQLKRGTAQGRDAAGTPPIPERLGEFRVVRELGRGGMGVVYEAVQESLGRHVALKVIHRVHLDARRLERFRRETRAVAQLHHTNIVPIFGVGEHDGLPFFAMQYIRGVGLDALLARWRAGGPVGDDRARVVAGIGVQAADALQYAHEQGILHRDIKPANLLLDEHGTLWITDFGLAKLTGQDDLTASGDVIGTLRYLAPEALRGVNDARGDVYSLGLTLYELSTLCAPFGDLAPSELLRQVGEGGLPRPRRLDQTIPRDLETIILKAIAREPAHRYLTAGDLARDLRRFAEDRPILARRATPVERAWRWARRNRTTAALTATAALSLLLAAAVGWIGYALTTRALEGESIRLAESVAATKRADTNVALSLQVFSELFNGLSPGGEPFPPPTGRAQPPRGPGVGRDSGPRGGPEGRRPPSPLGPNPFAPDAAKAAPPDGSRRPGTLGNVALLRSVLTFYETFARQNEADPRLQGEAARAYFKVGALYAQLGQEAESDEAAARAIAILESLIGRFPGVAEYRSRLVEVAIMAEPWSASPAALATLETRLRRARDVVDGLARESPADASVTQAAVHVHAKLGVVLQRTGRPSEAELCYRAALERADALLRRSPANDRARIDGADIREELALLLIDLGRAVEARALLDASASALGDLRTDAARGTFIADRYDILADDFRRLGDADRSEALARRAEEIRAHPRPQGRGPGRSGRA